jgi:hypothetical protein
MRILDELGEEFEGVRDQKFPVAEYAHGCGANASIGAFQE